MTHDEDQKRIEEWKKHPNIERIEVSTFGRVRLLNPRYKNREGIITQRIVRNYPKISIWNAAKQKGYHVFVHKLVLETFVGPRPAPHYDCDHIDNNRQNNNVENLRWITRHENQLRARRRVGEDHWAAKLTSEEVAYIRNNFKPRDNSKNLAKKFGVSKDTIYLIVRGKIWKSEKQSLASTSS